MAISAFIFRRRPRECTVAATVFAILIVVVGCGESESRSPAPTGSGTPVRGVAYDWLSAKRLPDEVARLDSIWCVESDTCLAAAQTVDVKGAIVRSEDGGNTWPSVTVFPDLIDVLQLECPGQLNCIALASPIVPGPQLVLSSSDGGATWQRTPMPSPITLAAISCPSAAFCIGEGFHGSEASLFRWKVGGSWERVGGLASVELFGDVFCVDEFRCWAVSFGGDSGSPQIFVTDDSGSTWVEKTPDFQLGSLAAVECLAPERCWVGGILSLAYTGDGGSTWGRVELPPTGNTVSIDAIECVASLDVCFAATGARILGSRGPVEWGFESTPAEEGHILDISCYLEACIAVGGTSSRRPIVQLGRPLS